MAAGRAPLSLKARALQLLAQREHSRLELRRKLLQHARRLAAFHGTADVCGTSDAGSASGPDDTADAGSTSDAYCTSVADRPSVSRSADAAASAEACVDEVLDWLVAERHLDERRFVESRIHVRQSRFGNRRIEQELQQHGVALEAAAVTALRQSELARAREVWRKRFGALATDAAGRAKQMRFLAGRGFSTDVIRRVMADPDGSADDDHDRHEGGD